MRFYLSGHSDHNYSGNSVDEDYGVGKLLTGKTGNSFSSILEQVIIMHQMGIDEKRGGYTVLVLLENITL